mmetsp:Transcript_15849/g.32582  ORF Transcript_15849/g.32582 Transcript_15849/m.32582 type:complete len:232 (-) Transcript_15849:8-703(-)
MESYEPFDLLSFQMYTYQPLPTQSIERNFMEITLMLTRTSICRQGFMGCIITTDTSKETISPSLDAYAKYVLVAQVNVPVFSTNGSDLHAEANAISTAASSGVSLANSTAYISMPPCKNCFMLLVAAGVKRIVSRKRVCETVRTWLDDSSKNTGGVVFEEVADTEESKARLLDLVRNSGCLDVEKVKELRRKRKEEEKERKKRRSENAEGNTKRHQKESLAATNTTTNKNI